MKGKLDKMISEFWDNFSLKFEFDKQNFLVELTVGPTNYKKKGGECPEVELEIFSKCLKIVASQAIRWFARQGENEKIF